MEALKDLRSEIDSLDRELIQLFAKRLELVSQVGKVKHQHGVPIYDSIQQYEYDYHLILLILIFYIIKINEELKHHSYC